MANREKKVSENNPAVLDPKSINYKVKIYIIFYIFDKLKIKVYNNMKP